jgi:hypothetical protein
MRKAFCVIISRRHACESRRLSKLSSVHAIIGAAQKGSAREFDGNCRAFKDETGYASFRPIVFATQLRKPDSIHDLTVDSISFKPLAFASHPGFLEHFESRNIAAVASDCNPLQIQFPKRELQYSSYYFSTISLTPAVPINDDIESCVPAFLPSVDKRYQPDQLSCGKKFNAKEEIAISFQLTDASIPLNPFSHFLIIQRIPLEITECFSV